MSLSILDGRRNFWQWDTDQQLLVEDTACGMVHYCDGTEERALVAKIKTLEDGRRAADVPNILLQTYGILVAYLYQEDEHGASTRKDYQFRVLPRPKPEDYVYTETEVLNYQTLAKRMDEWEEHGVPPEIVEGAIKEYFAENPVEAGATKEEADQIAKNKEDIEKLASDKLDATELPAAVNDALAEAKAIGLFDGAPGAPGEPGQPGNDYVLTPADKQEIAEMAAELVPAPDPGGSGSGGNVELDTTLTQSGKAADAKAVGDKFTELTGKSLIEPAWGDMPKIFFGAPLQQTKDEIICEFWYFSKTLSFHCYVEIKAQGNSTMNWPKKNQTLKMYKDAACTEKFKVDFKGWGKQNKFVIKANWRDLTHTRDIVSVRLESDCARSRSDFDEMPEELKTSPNLGAVDGFPVLVYAAGVYQGRYMFNIPKDKWAYNMDDDLDEHCMLCSEDYNSSCFRAAANINGNDWTDEIHDTVPASIKTRWNEVISFVMNSTDDEFVANLGSYINVNSLIDRHIMGMYSCDFDGYGKNQGYITYNGQLWYAVPYDKDGTWGNYWTGNSMLPSNYGRDQYEDMISGRPGNLLFIRLVQLFWKKTQDRWDYLKVNELSIPNTIHRFRDLYDITPQHLIAEDYASTTANGAFASIPNKTTCTIQQIEKFVVERHAWMDEYMANLGAEEPDEPEAPETVPCTGITLDKTELTFDGKGTQTITATVTPSDTTDSVVWVSSAPAVASISVEGTVCTVQSVADGKAVITVTCGDYNASCSITVSGIKKVNLLENVLIDKESYLNASTGATGPSQDAFVTEPVNVSSLQGATIIYCVKGTPSKSSTRIVFYDSDMEFISGHYDSVRAADILKVVVPDNAMYARFGGTHAGLSEISLDVPTSESIDRSSGEPGYIYNSVDGSKIEDNSHNCFKIPIVPGSRYYTNKFVSGAYYDQNYNFIEGLPWVSSNGYSGIFSVPEEVYYIGVNVGYNSVSSFEFYVNLRRIGYRTFTE